MALNLMDLFKHIKWAKNGDITDMSQTDYEIGWSHLGDDTPTVEDFNLVQQLADRKDQWLFGQIYEVLKANGIEPTEQNAQALLTSLQKMLLNVSNRAIPEAITELTKNTTSGLGHTHEIAKANTMTAGIVKLTNDTGLDSEALALTAKAGKLLAQQIAQNKLDADNKFIQNSKKSSAVDSNSADTVATSAAVKSANDNANGRVSKSGDTMSGDLVVPYLKATTEYISVTARDGNFAGLNIIRQGNFGNWLARVEALPDKRWKFWTESSLEIFLPARGGTVALDSDFSRNWYPNHYAGTEVYKVKHLGLMVVVMNTASANGEFVLPEAFDGHAICLAQDRGDGRISLEGSRFLGGNKIRLTGRSDTNCHVLVIGSKNV